MTNPKIHYATVLAGNESSTQEDYSPTACGRWEYEEYSANWKKVTCKKCLKHKPPHLSKEENNK